jgi:hypothetical protein
MNDKFSDWVEIPTEEPAPEGSKVCLWSLRMPACGWESWICWNCDQGQITAMDPLQQDYWTRSPG